MTTGLEAQSDAVALTARIKHVADDLGRNVETLRGLVEEARLMNASELLGYASWTAYLADVLSGVTKVKIDRETRRQLVGELTQQGMGTVAIGQVIGVGEATARRDQQSLKDEANERGIVMVLPDVMGRDGKTYSREAREGEPANPGQRRPLLENAKSGGHELRTTAKKFVRMADDDRFKRNRDAIVDNTTLVFDLTFTIDVCQRLLRELEGAGSGTER